VAATISPLVSLHALRGYDIAFVCDWLLGTYAKSAQGHFAIPSLLGGRAANNLSLYRQNESERSRKYTTSSRHQGGTSEKWHDEKTAAKRVRRSSNFRKDQAPRLLMSRQNLRQRDKCM
jgi:hypothetical protein